MRTAEEIKAWLESREWYDEYKAAVEADKTNQVHGYIEKYLSGSRGEMTIGGSFLWVGTPPQGVEVWGKRDAEFKEWYNN